MKRHLKKVVFGVLAVALVVASVAIAKNGTDNTKTTKEQTVVENTNKSGITMHYKWEGDTPHLYYSTGAASMSYPGVPMNEEGNGWYSYTIEDAKSADMVISVPSKGYETSTFNRTSGEYWYDENRGWFNENPDATQAGGVVQVDTDAVQVAAKEGITVHFVSDWSSANIYYWNALPKDKETAWPGEAMKKDSNGYYTYEFSDASKINLLFTNGSEQTDDLTLTSGEWWYINGTWSKYAPGEGPTPTPVVTVAPYQKSNDFRDETIYFAMTTRFYDGDPSNNAYCWDDAKLKSIENNDPGWRGDFKGLAEKLDYIKALGFSAVWITPVCQNASGLDYHGYHANNFKKVDARYESDDFTYQDLINAAHEKDMKIIQDIVLNHTSNFGEENLLPIMKKDDNADPENIDECMVIDDPNGIMPSQEEYSAMTGDEQYNARKDALKTDGKDTQFIYHHTSQTEWEQYSVQTGSIAGDCVDLDTENPIVSDYLIDAYTGYINMGVDAFRVDTVKHISRLTFNKEFVPAFKKAGGDNFYMFGECCVLVEDKTNKGIPCITSFFYTWSETKDYPWTDRVTRAKSAEAHWKDNETQNSADAMRTSDNAFLNGNEYHEPDYSQKSGFDMIDFRMHHKFQTASKAFEAARESEDDVYNDATWNVTYVDSHDYGPNNCLHKRYDGGTEAWAENLNLMFTHRGIPCVYYGSEIEFQANKQIDPRQNDSWVPYNESGRAYFGDHIEGSVNTTGFAEYNGATGAMAETLNYPLAKHIQRLNLIRRAVPALRKGQYSTKDVSGSGMSYRRRYTANGEDSYVLVNLSGQATFSNVLNGEYVEIITGEKVSVTNNTLTTEAVGKSNMRVYVLQNDTAKMYGANGKIGQDGAYLK